ncbi:MAG TPA: substrate-binding domain-containing protein [Acetobacteraceae bacterium]
MNLGRRDLGRASMLAVTIAGLAATAHADPSTAPNVVVYCDKSLRDAVRRTGELFTARTRAPMNLFSAAPTLMLAQIERITQNDVLITQSAAMDQAARRGLIHPDTRIPLGRDRLVFATLEGGTQRLSDPLHLLHRIGTGPLAVPDPTTGTTIDSAAVLAALGLTPPFPFKLAGAIDTEEVAFLLRTRAAPIGLLYRTEAQPGSGLSILAELPDQAVTYSAAISVVTRSRNAQNFMEFLRDPEAAAQLHASGLEPMA